MWIFFKHIFVWWFHPVIFMKKFIVEKYERKTVMKTLLIPTLLISIMAFIVEYSSDPVSLVEFIKNLIAVLASIIMYAIIFWHIILITWLLSSKVINWLAIKISNDKNQSQNIEKFCGFFWLNIGVFGGTIFFLEKMEIGLLLIRYIYPILSTYLYIYMIYGIKNIYSINWRKAFFIFLKSGFGLLILISIIIRFSSF